MSLTKATYSMIEGATYNVLDYGADPTGATDSTAAFQRAVDLAEDNNGGSIYVPSGTFLIDGQVNIGGSNIRVFGNGNSSVLLKAPTRTSLPTLYLTGGTQSNLEFDHIKFQSTLVVPGSYSFAFIDAELGTGDFDNISIHDNFFTCPNDNRICVIFASSNGVGVFTDRVVIRDNVFDDVLGAAIAVLNQNADTVVRNFDFKITGNIFHDCKDFAITISGPAENIVIANNSFTGTCGYGIELVAGVRGCVIEANVFEATFTADIMATSGVAPYNANSNILVKNNTTTQLLTATWTLQSCSLIYFEGNVFSTTGSMIFSGVNLGMFAWLVNNRITNGFSSINSASVLAFNNFIGSVRPYEGGYSKSIALSGGATTSTVVITTKSSPSNWSPFAVTVTCSQVEGTGPAGGLAQSVICFRFLDGTPAVQVSKTDLVTSANIALTTSYANNQLTVTATSGTANVFQEWKVEFLSPNLLSSVS